MKSTCLPRQTVLVLVVTATALPFLTLQGAEGPSAAAPAPESGSAAKLSEYASQLAKLSPRDAEGFFQLGRWCETTGLREQATKAYEQAVRIDPDHPQARAALGYRSLGTEWTKGAPKAPTRPAADAEKEGETATPRSERLPKPAAGPAKDAPGPKSTGPAVDGDGEEMKPEAGKLEDPVQAKKRWIQEAAAKLGLKFNLFEDEDFLVHTTYEGGSPKTKALMAALKTIKGNIVAFIGRPKGTIWPGKIQCILLRDASECIRFSEVIDGQRFPEGEGYYLAGDRTAGYRIVFSVVPEKALGFLLGGTALDRLGNSDRFIGAWLRDGIGGLIASATKEGEKEKFLEQAFARTAAEIEANLDGVTIFRLLEAEAADRKKGAAELGQMGSITLVHFFLFLGSSKFHQLIETLKSPEAPALPAQPDKLFYAQYTAFQERAITTVFRDKLEKLNERWKAYVTAKASQIEKPTKTDPGTKGGKTPQKKGGKTAGKTTGGNTGGGNTAEKKN